MTRNMTSLGEVAQFINGAAFKPEDWGDSGFPIIRIQNLTDESKPFNRTTRTVAEKLQVHPGDLLVSWSATLGVFTWKRPEIGLLNQHIFRVIPDESKVDKAYLRLALSGALSAMQKHLHGATMQHVNRGEFLGTPLYLPPLEEQRRIAAILDQAETLRTQRRTALALLDSLTQSLFLDMFGDPVANPKGWQRLPLSALVEKIDSGWSPVCLDRRAEEGEWAVLKLGAITSCEFKPQENKALPPDIAPVESIEVKPGDLLFSRKNTYELVAACALVNQTPARLMMSDLIFRFRLNASSAVIPQYLHRLLTYATKRQEVQKLAGGSAGSMPNISKAKLLDFLIEVPPLPLQQTFATRIASIEALKTTHRHALAALDALFASLQQRAFTGAL